MELRGQSVGNKRGPIRPNVDNRRSVFWAKLCARSGLTDDMDLRGERGRHDRSDERTPQKDWLMGLAAAEAGHRLNQPSQDVGGKLQCARLLIMFAEGQED